MNIQIEIINPEARGIIDELVKLNLIKITDEGDKKNLKDILSSLRKKSENSLSLDEITTEVETTRRQRFEKDRN